MTRVTVVIPTFNAARDLPACLDGLAKQTFRDFDVLVVDGRSPDGTADVARSRGVRVLLDEGRTRAHACETAIREARGPFVAFTDADCVPEPTWLEELVARLARAPASVASVGGPNVAPVDDTPLGRTVDVVYATRLMAGGTRYGFASEGDVTIHHNPGCNVLYRTEWLRAVGFEEFPTAEDVIVDHKIRTMGGTLLFTPAAVVRHRRRATIPSFFRQLRRYGEGRALAARKYNRLWQPVYPIPTVALLVSAVLLVAGGLELAVAGRARVLAVLGALALAYLGLAALDVASSRSPHLTPKRGLLAMLLIPVGQLGWAVGYLKGSLAHSPAFIARRQGMPRDFAYMAAAAGLALAAFAWVA